MKKKNRQLGIPYGTACNRLRKMILFKLLEDYGLNVCYRCKERIDFAEELSIEHKVHWLDNDVALFWDLDNIAFSHLSCNCKSKRQYKPEKKIRLHGLMKYKKEDCRCEICKGAKSDRNRFYRNKSK